MFVVDSLETGVFLTAPFIGEWDPPPRKGHDRMDYGRVPCSVGHHGQSLAPSYGELSTSPPIGFASSWPNF